MKILLSQLNFTVGDLSGNAGKIRDVIDRYGNDVDLIVFSELAVSGYPPLDLVEQSHFLALQDREVASIGEMTKGRKAAVALGCVSGEIYGGKKGKNCVKVFKNGDMIHWYAKHLLPTYNIFDEARHFMPGETNSPMKIAGKKVGFLICEDIWNDKGSNHIYDRNPIQELVLQGVEIIVSLNASPSNIGKQIERENMCREIAAKYGVRLVYVNQVGANDDIVFDGNSFVLNNKGVFVAHAQPFMEHNLIYDTDAEQEVFHILQSDTEIMYQHLVTGIGDYVRKCGFKSVVVGASGGIDSAVTLALATAALGPDNVKAITMPSGYSSQGSISDSEDLARNLGIELFKLPIEETFFTMKENFLLEVAEESETDTIGLEWENLQPRIRGAYLMAYANRYRGLVLSTGNKSELAVGYCTLYGDMCGGLGAIGDVYKMEVYDQAKYINSSSGRILVPKNTIDKEPSAELAPGQRDTDSLPPYPVLDAILQLYIEGGHLSPQEQVKRSEIIEKFAGKEGHDPLIRKIVGMVDRAEFKRRQAAPTIRCHARAFGSGRRLPIAQKFSNFA